MPREHIAIRISPQARAHVIPKVNIPREYYLSVSTAICAFETIQIYITPYTTRTAENEASSNRNERHSLHCRLPGSHLSPWTQRGSFADASQVCPTSIPVTEEQCKGNHTSSYGGNILFVHCKGKTMTSYKRNN